MLLLIVLGVLAVAGLLLTAVIEDMTRRARASTGCPPGCHCRGTRL